MTSDRLGALVRMGFWVLLEPNLKSYHVKYLVRCSGWTQAS